jgi:hypothetical protein
MFLFLFYRFDFYAQNSRPVTFKVKKNTNCRLIYLVESDSLKIIFKIFFYLFIIKKIDQ